LKATDVAIVFATLFGPIFAVLAADIRAKNKAQRDRQEWVYRTLVSTRGDKLRTDHVEAINNIEFAFPHAAYALLEDARKIYRAHLRNPDSISQVEAVRIAWRNKANELFADLLQQMADSLEIPFQRSEILQDSYRPDAHLINEVELGEIRTLLLSVLKNGRPINIRTVDDQHPEPGVAAEPPVIRPPESR